MCSTPEGIGGGIRSFPTSRCCREPVLNARRHRRGNQNGNRGQGVRTSCCAQRPKASEGESGSPSWFLSSSAWCSTPEGIGGGISLLDQGMEPSEISCSTPEGIGGGIRMPGQRRQEAKRRAQRPKASEGESAATTAGSRSVLLLLCSTPEGIGGGIRRNWYDAVGDYQSAQRPKASEGESEYDSGQLVDFWLCSTPEGIGGGIRFWWPSFVLRLLGAQRPKASEGESGSVSRLASSIQISAQRPKASEGESGSCSSNGRGG